MALNPTEMWDTHIHCFNPEKYPFKATRTYTPGPAPLEALLQNCKAKRINLVQASVENGYQGLVAHLRRIHAEHPHILARGTICMDEDWQNLTDQEFDFFHSVGIRSCRIHGFFGTREKSMSNVEQQIRQFASSYPAQKFGWSLSAQLPLAVWASLKTLIQQDPGVSSLTIIADHNGCATPADIGSVELDAFVSMLQPERFYVKVSALYRRSPQSIHEMQPIISQFATLAPQCLLWGSDWPHVDSSNRALDPPSPADIDTKRVDDVPAELCALNSWLNEKQWKAMFKDNPDRLFGI